MNRQLQQLYEHLDLEALGDDVFQTKFGNEGWRQIFGGQVLAQALLSASCTVDAERQPHSLHAYFLRPGDKKAPIRFQVERLRDGRSFTTRRITAIQHGAAILNMAASFQISEDGMSHQVEMPQVPPPQVCLTRAQLAEMYRDSMPEEMFQHASRPFAIDLRPVEPENLMAPEVRPPHRMVWLKLNDTLPSDYPWHRHMLAYASDMTLLETSLRPHEVSMFTPNLQMASLDHSMWFHRPFRMDEWLLYVIHGSTASGSRGLVRGQLFTRDGRLVASAVQEGLMRLRTR